MRKKILNFISILMTVLIFGVLFSSCAQPETAVSEKITIVTTIFPNYDFARAIAGEHAEVIMLLPTGTDSHTYEPTPLDMKKINDADIFIYTGESMEPWAHEILQSADNKNLIAVATSSGIELLETKSEHEDEDTHEDEADHELDPHIWLDPFLAKIMVENIAQALIIKDPENEQNYSDNSLEYIDLLDKLDSDYIQAINQTEGKTLVFGGKFAYAYLINRYDIDYISAYEGFSSHDEPSVQSIVNIVDFMIDNDIEYIYHEQLTDPKVAKSIAEQTGASLLVLSNVETVSSQELDNGITYLDIMYQNLENIKKGLS